MIFHVAVHAHLHPYLYILQCLQRVKGIDVFFSFVITHVAFYLIVFRESRCH